MDRLSSNAWKVVSYVAARQFSEDPAARNFRTRQRDYLPVAISLKEFCEGLRVKRRWKTRGTGLSKSSVAIAINEAVRAGILQREQRRGADGRTLSSQYTIEWHRVLSGTRTGRVR